MANALLKLINKYKVFLYQTDELIKLVICIRISRVLMMDEFQTVIFSEEKNEGKGILIAAILFFIPTFALALSAIFNASVSAAIGSFVFLIFTSLLYICSVYSKRKYQQLGTTPLTITPGYCTLGDNINGSISVERAQFTKIKVLSLICWKKSKAGTDSGSVRQDKVWETSITPKINYLESTTILDFEFTIPADKKPTDERFTSAKKYYWELSFEFVESLSKLKRCWKIPVKP